MSKNLWITVGVSGSGKTTWALEVLKKYPNSRIICRDDYRKLVLAYKKKQKPEDFKWSQWKWKWESEVDNLRDIDIEVAIERGENVILADTNLSERNYLSIARRFVDEGYEIQLQPFPITWDEAIARNAHRPNGVSYSVLQQQFEKWNQLFPEFEPFKNNGQYPTIIVDIDGTVAIMGSRGPYDWSRVGEDTPNQHVVDIVTALSATHNVVFMSGRDSECRMETIEWLDKIFPTIAGMYDLYMRKEGDQRKDNIVKRELLDLVHEDLYISMVIDDRPQVCRMWRQIGLNVIQVADPYKEF